MFLVCLSSHSIRLKLRSIMSVHEAAVAGFRKGKNYDDNRPSYTDEAVDIISQKIADVNTLKRTAVKYDVLELGAGTGLFTRKLLSVLPKETRYIATEPSGKFLETLREKSPNLETRQCPASDIPLPENSVKAIICAQSFHWFSNCDTLQEMRRVLVDGGKLVLIWNYKDRRVPWLREILNYIQTQDTSGTVHIKDGYKSWMNVFKEYTGFRDEENIILPGVEYKGDHEFLLQHFSSISAMSALSEERREEVLEDIRDILREHPETRDKDIINIPFTTDLYIYTCYKN